MTDLARSFLAGKHQKKEEDAQLKDFINRRYMKNVQSAQQLVNVCRANRSALRAAGVELLLEKKPDKPNYEGLVAVFVIDTSFSAIFEPRIMAIRFTSEGITLIGGSGNKYGEKHKAVDLGKDGVTAASELMRVLGKQEVKFFPLGEREYMTRSATRYVYIRRLKYLTATFAIGALLLVGIGRL